MNVNYPRLYITIALILLVTVGWLSILSAFAIVLLGILISIEYKLHLLVFLIAKQTPQSETSDKA